MQDVGYGFATGELKDRFLTQFFYCVPNNKLNILTPICEFDRAVLSMSTQEVIPVLCYAQRANHRVAVQVSLGLLLTCLICSNIEMFCLFTFYVMAPSAECRIREW